MFAIQSAIFEQKSYMLACYASYRKLQHADEEAARQLVANATSSIEDANDANILTDTGWFELRATKIPTGDDLAALQNSVGDSKSLQAPEFWSPVKDPTVVQIHKLRDVQNAEYKQILKSFLSTLVPPEFKSKVAFVRISRIQNLAMWQSYVVKRQSICYRETGLSGGQIKTKEALLTQERALQRFERKWLWHGTNVEVMTKIIQQGFNRYVHKFYVAENR